MRQELIALNEIDAALELDKYIRDVSKELHFAEKSLLNLESINYDMSLIIDWQNHLYNKYTCRYLSIVNTTAFKYELLYSKAVV